MTGDTAAAERRRTRGRRLTDRQTAVLELVASGLENKEIAHQLGISEQAVKEHVSNLLRLLAAPNRAALGDAAATMRFLGSSFVAPDWMRFLFQDAPMHIAVVSGPEHHFVAMNDAYRKAAGDRELVGLSYRDAFPEREASLNLLDRVYRSGERFVENELPRRFTRTTTGAEEDGYVAVVLQPLPDAAGTAGVAIFSIDVTDSVRARPRLQELEAEQLAILDLLRVGVIVSDEQGRMVKANSAARELVSLPSAPVRLTPQLLSEYLLRDAADGRAIGFEEMPTVRALRGEPCGAVTYRVRDPVSNHERVLHVSAMSLRGTSGEVRGSVTIIEDAGA